MSRSHRALIALVLWIGFVTILLAKLDLAAYHAPVALVVVLVALTAVLVFMAMGADDPPSTPPPVDPTWLPPPPDHPPDGMPTQSSRPPTHPWSGRPGQ